MIDLFSSPFDGKAGTSASSRNKGRRRDQPEPAGAAGSGGKITTPAEELIAELAREVSAEEKAQMLTALENAAGAVGRLRSLLDAGEAVAAAAEG